jgi:DNA-binding XRE family transcriptional regulator
MPGERMKKKIDKENKNTVAYRVIKIRNTLNIKGKDLASRIKISQPCLSEIEKGKYYPNFEFMFNIAREFNVNLYYLVFGEGEMFIEPGKHTDYGILEELLSSSSSIRKFLYYFERSEIVRFFILSEFKQKLMLEKDIIEKEIAEFEKDGKG